MPELMINDIVPYSFGSRIIYAQIVGIKIVTEIIAGERTGVFTEQFYTIKDRGVIGSIRSDYKAANFKEAARKRLEKLRIELRAERISTIELLELQTLIPFIADDDIELLEATGVPE
jgi:hypothetical protein